jgi:xeroderma pigmentosum group C-complementing protein
MIHKSRIPDDVKRGCLFEQAISRLASWWADTFFTVKPTGHLRSRTFEDVQDRLRSRGLLSIPDKKGKGKAVPPDVDPFEDLFEDSEDEVVRSAKSLMKHALMRTGSRDVSAQLFTALCRALGIPTRLVVSIQSVPWKTNVGRPKAPSKPKGAKSKGKGVERGDAGRDSSEYAQEVGVDGDSSGDHMQVDADSGDIASPVNGKGKGKGKAHTIKLRKTKSVGRKLGSRHQTGAHLFS